eukprot:PhF_6_TR28239/c0_g1_i1/m.41768
MTDTATSSSSKKPSFAQSQMMKMGWVPGTGPKPVTVHSRSKDNVKGIGAHTAKSYNITASAGSWEGHYEKTLKELNEENKKKKSAEADEEAEAGEEEQPTTTKKSYGTIDVEMPVAKLKVRSQFKLKRAAAAAEDVNVLASLRSSYESSRK